MEKTYDPKTVEEKIYAMWEQGGYFTPHITQGKKPFTILLPLPNANDPMHMGHALFTVEDIMVRYHRMLGDPTLWLPGGDHAGIETQFVFEKFLAKQGKSRFDYDRKTLYTMIEEFVNTNKSVNKDQMKRLGFSLDFSRYHYSLEPDIVKKVLLTFKKLHDDNLIYREERLVNYCTKCGTGFSDLEVKHIEQTDSLYFLKYGPFILATTRPETKFGDTAVAVHPTDKRYAEWIGKTIEFEGLLGTVKLQVVADEAVDPEFGTGVVKVTPAHDMTDYEIGKRHNLPIKQIIGLDGKLTEATGAYKGLRVKAARIKIVEDLKSKHLIDHIDESYVHSVGTCYRCGTILEPMLMPQWFIKTKPLAEPAIQAVKEGKTKIVPLKRFEKLYFDWMEHIKDWNISRQIVWGPRIPVWYCLSCNPTIKLSFIDSKGNTQSGTYEELKKTYDFTDIEKGLQSLIAPINASYSLKEGLCPTCHGKQTLQETDTFDTWFLSGQWPITTLLTQCEMSNVKCQMSNLKDYKTTCPNSDLAYFYPTSVLDTLWDILFFWVARMMMFGLYLTGDVPFKIIHLHSRVVDRHGVKMSKSKGNVVNPIEMVDTYGADALRMALIFGAAPGSDIAVSEDKIRGMRNFANKLWNIARLFTISIKNLKADSSQEKILPFYDETLHNNLIDEDKQIISELNMLVAEVTKHIDTYRFSDAAQNIYDFTWHRIADTYLEKNKKRFADGDKNALSVFRHIILTLCKLLHPFMPFVTEEIWKHIPKEEPTPLIVSQWPQSKNKKQITKDNGQ